MLFRRTVSRHRNHATFSRQSFITETTDIASSHYSDRIESKAFQVCREGTVFQFLCYGLKSSKSSQARTNIHMHISRLFLVWFREAGLLNFGERQQARGRVQAPCSQRWSRACRVSHKLLNPKVCPILAAHVK